MLTDNQPTFIFLNNLSTIKNKTAEAAPITKIANPNPQCIIKDEISRETSFLKTSLLTKSLTNEVITPYVTANKIFK